jgi:hypothetical protein
MNEYELLFLSSLEDLNVVIVSILPLLVSRLHLLPTLPPAEADVPRHALSSYIARLCSQKTLAKAGDYSQCLQTAFNLKFHCCDQVVFSYSNSFCSATTLPTITLSNYTSLASRLNDSSGENNSTGKLLPVSRPMHRRSRPASEGCTCI